MKIILRVAFAAIVLSSCAHAPDLRAQNAPAATVDDRDKIENIGVGALTNPLALRFHITRTTHGQYPTAEMNSAVSTAFGGDGKAMPQHVELREIQIFE